jgi:hypothetical protein
MSSYDPVISHALSTICDSTVGQSETLSPVYFISISVLTFATLQYLTVTWSNDVISICADICRILLYF